MGKITYTFKTPGLKDWSTTFDLRGTDRQIEVPIEITDAQLQTASMTHDLAAILHMTMTDRIAAINTIVAIGSADSVQILKAYNIDLYGLEGLFMRTVQSAIEKYVEADYELSNRIKEESK